MPTLHFESPHPALDSVRLPEMRSGFLRLDYLGNAADGEGEAREVGLRDFELWFPGLAA